LLKNLLEYTNIFDTSYLLKKDKNTLYKFNNDEFSCGNNDKTVNYSYENEQTNCEVDDNSDTKYLNHFKIIENDDICSMDNTRNVKNRLYNLCEEVLLQNKEFYVSSYSNEMTDNDNNDNNDNNNNNDNRNNINYNDIDGNHSQRCIHRNSFLNKYIDNAAAYMIKRLNGHLFYLIRNFRTFSAGTTDVRTSRTFSSGTTDVHYRPNLNNDSDRSGDNNKDGKKGAKDNNFNNSNDNDSCDKNSDFCYHNTDDNKFPYDKSNLDNDNYSEIVSFILSELNGFVDLRYEEQISVTSLMFEIVCILCSLILYDDIDSSDCCDENQNENEAKYCNRKKSRIKNSDDRGMSENYEILIKILEKLILIQKKIKNEIIMIHDYETKLNFVYDILSYASLFDLYKRKDKIPNSNSNISPIRDSIKDKNIEKNKHYDFISRESNTNKHALESYIIINECMKEFIGFIYGMKELNSLLKTTFNYSNIIHKNTNIYMGTSKHKSDKFKNSTNKVENIEDNCVYVSTSNKSDKNEKKYRDLNVDYVNTYDTSSTMRNISISTIDNHHGNRKDFNNNNEDNHCNNYDMYPISVPHIATPDRYSPSSILDYDSEEDDMFNSRYNTNSSIDDKERVKKMNDNQTTSAKGDNNDKGSQEEDFLIEYNVLYEELMSMHVQI
jgi:hypothetical protein